MPKLYEKNDWKARENTKTILTIKTKTIKSTILQIIVKQWFRDKAGIEVDDSVLDSVFKELTEQPETSQGIHYQSEKDAESKEVSEWISVNDSMPEENACKISKDILTFNYEGECNVGYTCRGIFKRFNNYDTINIENITHWRHLPKPPKNN